MNRRHRELEAIDALSERAAWLHLPTLNLDGVHDLDALTERLRAHERRARRYADELADIARDAVEAVGALEEP